MVLLHGGGLSHWSLLNVISLLEDDFQIITPIVDGHGEDATTEFIRIENVAQKLIRHLADEHNGNVFAIAGLSLGAQITVEILTLQPDIADFAIIESALVFPIKGINTFVKPMYQLFYGLMQQKWFSKLQAKALWVPQDMFDQYYNDSRKMARQTLINIATSNGNYKIKESQKDSCAKTLIIVGSKELEVMKKSAKRLSETIKLSQIHLAEGMKYGEFSLVYSDKYVQLIKSFATYKPSTIN